MTKFFCLILLSMSLIALTGCRGGPDEDLDAQPWGSGHQGHNIPNSLLEGR